MNNQYKMTDIFYIDDIILNIPEDEILILPNINPRFDEIFMPFVNNLKLNVVKYTLNSTNFYNNEIQKYYFEFPRFYTDLITSIKTDKDCKLLINKYEHDINITLPIMNMNYTKTVLIFDESSEIIYDVYLFSDDIRNKYKKQRLVNKDLMFYMGGTYQYNS